MATKGSSGDRGGYFGSVGNSHHSGWKLQSRQGLAKMRIDWPNASQHQRLTYEKMNMVVVNSPLKNVRIYKHGPKFWWNAIFYLSCLQNNLSWPSNFHDWNWIPSQSETRHQAWIYPHFNVLTVSAQGILQNVCQLALSIRYVFPWLVPCFRWNYSEWFERSIQIHVYVTQSDHNVLQKRKRFVDWLGLL